MLDVTACTATNFLGENLNTNLLRQEVWSVGLQQEFVEGEVAGHIVGLHTLSVGDHGGQSNIQPGEGLHPPLGPRVVTRKTVTVDLVVSRHHLPRNGNTRVILIQLHVTFDMANTGKYLSYTRMVHGEFVDKNLG